MAFFGPGFTLDTRPRWRQSWWWRERLPGIITMSVVVLLAVGAGVVGWMSVGDDDTGSDPLPQQTASTATPTGPARPTEKRPERPDAVKDPSPAGVEALVRFEFDAINYAQRTGDFEPLRPIYQGDCKRCTLLIEELTKSLRGGSTYVDREYVITSLTVEGIVNGERGQKIGQATVGFQQPKEARLVDKDGRELGRVPATPEYGASYELEYSSDGWTIHGAYSRNKP